MKFNTQNINAQVSLDEWLHYGSGVSTDLRFLDFANRIFEPGAVKLHVQGGEIYSARERPDLWNFRLKIKEPLRLNPYFKENAEKPTDTYIVRLGSSGECSLNFEQIKANALCHVLLMVDPGIQVRLVENIRAQDYFGLILDVIVGAHSRLEYSVHQNTSKQTTNMILRTFSVSGQADVYLTDVEIGGKLSLAHTWIRLEGARSRGEIYGGFFGNDSQKFDVYNLIEHAAPLTVSRMIAKGALDDSAKAIYRGLIRMHPGAEEADGSQSEDTLLLSNKAEISSVPDLEIAHHRVKCSHAVSTSRIDKEKLFFMNSRGIETPEALRALVEGHFSPILDACGDVIVKSNMSKSIEEKLRL